jgi:hypothetical protein
MLLSAANIVVAVNRCWSLKSSVLTARLITYSFMPPKMQFMSDLIHFAHHAVQWPIPSSICQCEKKDWQSSVGVFAV